jgi:hypothetical protein
VYVLIGLKMCPEADRLAGRRGLSRRTPLLAKLACCKHNGDGRQLALGDLSKSCGKKRITTLGDRYRVEVCPALVMEVWKPHRQIRRSDPEFADRRELWRIFSYLAIVAVEGESPFGQRFLRHLIETLHRYR